MNTIKELEKIVEITKAGKFIHKGSAYKLDKKATETHPINNNLGGKPIRKFVGLNKDDQVLLVWSHDCEVVPVEKKKAAPKKKMTPKKKINDKQVKPVAVPVLDHLKDLRNDSALVTNAFSDSRDSMTE